MATFTKIEDELPLRLAEASLEPRGRVFPSPAHFGLAPGRIYATWSTQLTIAPCT